MHAPQSSKNTSIARFYTRTHTHKPQSPAGCTPPPHIPTRLFGASSALGRVAVAWLRARCSLRLHPNEPRLYLGPQTPPRLDVGVVGFCRGSVCVVCVCVCVYACVFMLSKFGTHLLLQVYTDTHRHTQTNQPQNTHNHNTKPDFCVCVYVCIY